jgi:ketosteroid isomerase-like protein
VGQHPNAQVVREAFDALERDDIMTIYEALDPDVVWHNGPAAGPWSGDFKGRDDVLAMSAQFSQHFAGTFKEHVHDILASEEHVVALLHEVGTTPSGRRFDNRASFVFHMRDVKITECWTLDYDVAAAAAFWAADAEEEPVEPAG